MITSFAFGGMYIYVMPLFTPQQTKLELTPDLSLQGDLKKFRVMSNQTVLFEYKDDSIYIYPSSMITVP